jgi:uncharacterized protein (DUF58 family)
VENLLFEPQFLRKLENMAFVLKKSLAGRYSGQHRSTLKGQSVEFADYRSYVSGDDFRQVDWHAYARLERLFVKLFMEEKDLTLHLLVDTSASMGWQGGEKLKLAKQLAGALGYLALANSEQVGAAALGKKVINFLPGQRGRATVQRFWNFLSRLEPEGATDLNAALRQMGKHIKNPGIIILVSDMLSPEGYSDGIKYLQKLGQQVVILQILAPEERDPMLLGNFALVDCESNLVKEVSITPLLLEAYKKQVDEFVTGVRSFCLEREITYTLIDPREGLEQILLHSLRGLGVIA